MVGTKPFLDEVPTYEIRDGNMYITADGFELAMPLRKFRLGMARAQLVIDEYERGNVVRFPRGKGGRRGKADAG